MEGRSRRRVGRAARHAARPVRDARARPRAPPVHRVHERDHRPAEGRGARARRVPRQDRRGGRVPDRRAPGRDPLLVRRPRLDHGTVGDRRRDRARRDGVLFGHRPRPPGARPPLGHGRAPPHHAPRRLADADPRAHPPRRGAREAARPLEPSDLGLDGRAVEPRAVAMVLRGGRRPPLPDHQPVGRDRGRRVLPVAPPDLAARALHAPRTVARDGPRRRGCVGRAGPPGPGRRARLPAAVAGHDARHLGRPRTVPGHVLAPIPGGVGPRRLGQRGRGRVLVPPRALRRHDQPGG